MQAVVKVEQRTNFMGITMRDITLACGCVVQRRKYKFRTIEFPIPVRMKCRKHDAKPSTIEGQVQS